MKKNLIFLIFLLLIFSLSACKISFKIGDPEINESDTLNEIKNELDKFISENKKDDNTENSLKDNKDNDSLITDSEDKNTNNEPDNTTTNSNKNYLFSNVNGYWVTLSNECYRFDSLGNFYWYKSYDDLTDNYYKGTYKISNSFDAINELKLDYSNVLNLIDVSEGTITQDDIYCIKTYPTYLISNGIDKSKTNLSEGSYSTYLFLKISENSAQMLNYQTGSKLFLTKK